LKVRERVWYPSLDPLPIVLIPHGGPHSAFSAGFSVYLATLVACGFAVLAVNYRGSTGFGQESLTSLLGHIGEIDVADCMQALRDIVGLSASTTSTEEELSSFSDVEKKVGKIVGFK
jgi:dipeptidyl aminopeptidase/acylaminoacyl peptidase